MTDQPTPPKPSRRPPAFSALRPIVDTADFCRRGESAQGVQPVVRLPRLQENLFDDEGDVTWRVSGRRNARPDGGADRWLTLHLQARVGMECDRCLQRVDVSYEGEREYLLLASEQQAASADADIDDYDVLVGSSQFDLLALVEDEAIMMQPISVQHDDCDLPAQLDPEDEPEPEDNPFAVLAALRKPGGGDSGGGQDGTH